MSKITVKYSPLERTKIETVKLCDSSDIDYQNHIAYLSSKPHRSSLHLELYKKHKEAFDYFGEVLKEFYNESFSSVEFYQKHYNEPVKIQLRYVWGDEGEKRESNINYWSAYNCKNYFNENNLSLEEKSLRCAWYFCEFAQYTNNSCFNLAFLTNVAIDIVGLPFHRKPIAQKAKMFEQQAIEQISKHLEIKASILKYTYKNESWFHFKKMDCFCFDKIYNQFYVLEMFTYRDEQEKVLQVQDYCFLLNLCGYKNLKPLLITENLGTDYITYKNYSEGINRYGVQLYTPKGFLVKILNGEIA